MEQVSAESAGAERSHKKLRYLAKQDKTLAWVVILLPLFGTVTAGGLIVAGYAASWRELAVAALMYLLALVGVEVGFHRLFAHRSYDASRMTRLFLAICGSMAFEGPVIWWAATHRRHHQFSDHDGDPHSPNLSGCGILGTVRGLYHAHMGWLFISSSTRTTQFSKYAPDLYRDRDIFYVHMHYFMFLLSGFAIPAVIDGALSMSLWGAFLGFLWGGLVRIFVMNHLVYWCINSVTHRFGSRPFKTNDNSTNNIWLVLPTLGQAWHNNHHAFPYSAVMSLQKWQADPGAWILRMLEHAGLVWNIKVPSRERIEAKLGTFAEEAALVGDNDETYTR